MTFFDIFKKTPPHTHNEKVNFAYKCYNQDMVEIIFPGGKVQASNIIISLAKLFNVNLDACNAQEYYNILSIFSDVFIRSNITNMDDKKIVIHLQMEHSNYIKNMNINEKVLAFCKLNMDDHTFTLNNPDKISLLEEYFGKMTDDEHKATQTSIKEKSINTPDYGLCMTNPIYTNNLNDTKAFLNTLKSTLGETLNWEQREILDVDGIEGEVIVYVSYLPSGKSYKTVYINEHGINAGAKIPKGFTTVKSKPTVIVTPKEESYYFENSIEFTMYVKFHNKGTNIKWISNDKYIELYKKGYQLFECGQYTKAIDIYKKCLELNPIGISARFELVECYIMINQLPLARKRLYEMKDYLFDNTQKARFYRRIGYIDIEEGSFKEAYACYQYSLNYENHPSVFQEMKYIESKVGNSVKKISAKNVLNAYNVPII